MGQATLRLQPVGPSTFEIKGPIPEHVKLRIDAPNDGPIRIVCTHPNFPEFAFERK